MIVACLKKRRQEEQANFKKKRAQGWLTVLWPFRFFHWSFSSGTHICAWVCFYITFLATCQLCSLLSPSRAAGAFSWGSAFQDTEVPKQTLHKREAPWFFGADTDSDKECPPGCGRWPGVCGGDCSCSPSPGHREMLHTGGLQHGWSSSWRRDWIDSRLNRSGVCTGLGVLQALSWKVKFTPATCFGWLNRHCC